MSPLRPGKSLFFGALLFAGLCVASADLQAQGVLIPLLTRHSAVFDHAGRYLYISTSDGWVRPYNLVTGQLETGYNLGKPLGGLDISPNDSCLLVVQNDNFASEGTIHRLDLPGGNVTKIHFPISGLGSGANIAVGSRGVALFSTSDLSQPLRQFDLATNTISIPHDLPKGEGLEYLTSSCPIHRNAKGTYFVLNAATSTGTNFVYDAENNSFRPPTHVGGRDHVAINTDGTLLANGFRFSVSLDSAIDYSLVHVFGHLGAGVAFDPIDDTLYATSIFTNEIVAYDSKTFAVKFRLPVGELVDEAEVGNPRNQLLSSPDGNYLALITASGVRLFRVRPRPPAPPPPEFELAQDMVFDRAGHYLYIATYRGFIWPYNLATGKLEAPYNLGGIINGIDIAPDDSCIIAAQNYRGVNQGIFQKLNLKTGAVTNLPYELKSDSFEHGSWDVAIAANGKAFGSTYVNGSAFNSLREIDIIDNQVTRRSDGPAGFISNGQGRGTQIHRSADRKRLLFLEVNISSGPIFSYDATTDQFGPAVDHNKFWDFTAAAVNRDGTLMDWAFGSGGIGYGNLITLPNQTNLYSFTAITSGVAFDAVRDVLYGVSRGLNSSQIIGYDTSTFAETMRLDIGESVPDFGQFDVGNLVASQDGRYLAVITPTTVRVLDVVDQTVSALPTPPPTNPHPGRLANLSTRAVVRTGDSVPIGGFVISGPSTKNVIVRGLGPSLTEAGIQGALQDPSLELYDATGHLIAKNDNWLEDYQGGTIDYYGLNLSDIREAAIFASLAPGAYTAVLRGSNGTTGVGLVEIYDIQPTSASRLANISTRSLVGVNQDVMIAGIIIQDSLTKVVCRAIGPSLSAFGISEPLLDPKLDLYDSQGTVIRSNDNWEINGAEIWNAGLSPTIASEAAILTELGPGAYTAIVRGNLDSTGVGLVEIYQLPEK